MQQRWGLDAGVTDRYTYVSPLMDALVPRASVRYCLRQGSGYGRFVGTGFRGLAQAVRGESEQTSVHSKIRRVEPFRTCFLAVRLGSYGPADKGIAAPYSTTMPVVC